MDKPADSIFYGTSFESCPGFISDIFKAFYKTVQRQHDKTLIWYKVIVIKVDIFDGSCIMFSLEKLMTVWSGNLSCFFCRWELSLYQLPPVSAVTISFFSRTLNFELTMKTLYVSSPQRMLWVKCTPWPLKPLLRRSFSFSHLAFRDSDLEIKSLKGIAFEVALAWIWCHIINSQSRFPFQMLRPVGDAWKSSTHFACYR